jgi:diadenosine tetraphosphate (Ap4A) HIT family hydrolase
MLGRPIVWAKSDSHFDLVKHIASSGSVVVFEDEHVIAYEDDDDEREGAIKPGERRITIAPRKPIASLLDIGIADAQVSAHLLFALQQVAFKLNLHKTGFEVRFNVLPPYQRRPHLSLHIRTGDPKKGEALG